ncbi:FMN-binding protein [Haloplasma contractile]|uniref:FMN-binding domain-containing protein n=1 Tax=Haloplasma contractile SSD-17B TaxID=1033810 RepID=F7Q1N8_9MOLU|nr:FMN-binding protein [Haloplasma contractile]ERJ12904.1 FMN-binding domain-containing protein [Haloplasma contractile SSD-17B]
MKKLSLLIFSLFAIGSISACNPEDTDDITDTTEQTEQTDDTQDTTDQNNDTAEKIEYNDGTYTGYGDPWDYGYETADITIENGDITQVVLHRWRNDDTEVDYDNWTGAEIDGKLYPNLKQYRLDMASEIIDQQSLEGVDYIAGATITTENWILAVQDALNKALK